MSESSPKTPTCPLDKQDCEWLTEVEDLRRANFDLYQLVTTDPLTGLFNFRHMQRALDAEMERTRRCGVATSVVIVDLDYFKRVNDRWGHEGGNSALRTAARVFQQVTRAFDIICRYGGEEFVIILPQTALPMAIRVAERIRQTLEQCTIEHDGNSFNITASLGVSSYRQHQTLSADKLLEDADSWLYQAKHQGRNRVCYPPVESIHAASEVSQDEKSALLAPGANQD